MFIISEIKIAGRSQEDKVDKAVPFLNSAPCHKVMYGMEV
jgi:hypothetical protein